MMHTVGIRARSLGSMPGFHFENPRQGCMHDQLSTLTYKSSRFVSIPMSGNKLTLSVSLVLTRAESNTVDPLSLTLCSCQVKDLAKLQFQSGYSGFVFALTVLSSWQDMWTVTYLVWGLLQYVFLITAQWGRIMELCLFLQGFQVGLRLYWFQWASLLCVVLK